MLRIEYSQLAVEDLKHLQEYLTTNWGESVANRILKNITHNIRMLEQYPLSGVDLGKVIDITTDYRYIFTKKNYVFYRLEFDRVLVVRVISERQDYLLQLFGIDSK